VYLKGGGRSKSKGGGFGQLPYHPNPEKKKKPEIWDVEVDEKKTTTLKKNGGVTMGKPNKRVTDSI